MSKSCHGRVNVVGRVRRGPPEGQRKSEFLTVVERSDGECRPTNRRPSQCPRREMMDVGEGHGTGSRNGTGAAVFRRMN